MQDLKSIETFVAVATRGSFRGAAAALHTTQPAVSQRIAEFERALGARLLDRGSRHVRLTEAGRDVLAHAERILVLGGEMRRAAKGGDAVAGTLRLGVAETIVHAWLSAFVARVGADHPDLALEIEVDTTPELASSLGRQEIDLAFMLGPSSDPEVESVELSRFPVRFLASPALGLGPGRIHRDVLARHTLITFARRTRPFAALAAAMTAPHLPPPRIHACAALAPVVRLALDGVGIAAIPPVIAAEEIARGRLRVLDSEVSLPDLAFAACWMPGRGSRHAPRVAAIAREVARASADKPD
jgi:DNA-binding transcriptional LysR family regulator